MVHAQLIELNGTYGRGGARSLDRTVRVGCSGWQYAHWRGDFYPAELPTSRWFAHYALRFDTVEINNSFYRLPPEETFAKWREQAPPHFLYAVKASRFLTHMKKLKDPEDPLARFFDNAKALGPRLGPVLYQLPPRWPLNLERFEIFLRAIAPAARRAGLRTRHHNVVEFRDPSWYDEHVYELLRRYDVALCLHDMQGSASGKRLVGPFIYVRFHGTRKYGGRYPDARLDDWADWLAERAAEGLHVFAYIQQRHGRTCATGCGAPSRADSGALGLEIPKPKSQNPNPKTCLMVIWDLGFGD